MATVVQKRHVAERPKDRRRWIAVEVALELAELNAGWGDYERALEHLAAADQLAGGAVSPRFAELRRQWLVQAAAGH